MVKSSTGQDAKLKRRLDWIAVTDHSDGMRVFNELQDGNPELMANPTAKRWYDIMQQGSEEARGTKKEVVSAFASLSDASLLRKF